MSARLVGAFAVTVALGLVGCADSSFPDRKACEEGDACRASYTLAFHLSWDTDADLDLSVTRPDDVQFGIFDEHESDIDGGKFENDYLYGEDAERVGFERPMDGRYTVCVVPFRVEAETHWVLRVDDDERGYHENLSGTRRPGDAYGCEPESAVLVYDRSP